MARQSPRPLIAGIFLLLAAPAVADEPKPKAKHPLEALDSLTTLRSDYLIQPLTFPDDVKGHSVIIRKGMGNDEIGLELDPNVTEFNLFGDATKRTGDAGVHQFTAKLVEFRIPDPAKLDRRIFAIESKVLGEGLFLVIPTKKDDKYRLVRRDKDGKITAVVALTLVREPPPPPCHPGCFPTGTLVHTPDGLKKIETIKPGDTVLVVPAKGKPAAMKVASVFKGEADLVEIDTEAGKLITTAKQPLSLAAGGVRSSGSLVKDDAIQRWQDGKVQAVKVRGVKKLEKPAPVFNLVLKESGTFIANGYLVRSKPPPEK